MTSMNRWHRLLAPGLAMVSLAALTTMAAAQVTPEQQSAIRASCRPDFTSKCSGVTPGGKDALQCLQKNVASLAPACKTAVSATIPAPAAPAAPVPKPAAATPPPPPAPAAKSAAPPAPAVSQAAPKPPRVQKPVAPAAATVAPPAPPSAPAPPALSRQEEDALVRQSCSRRARDRLPQRLRAVLVGCMPGGVARSRAEALNGG
jgi:hypothetical protein